MALLSILVQLLATVSLLYLLELARKHYNSSLRKYPGPLLAKFTNLWRLLEARRGHTECTQLKLHEKYGSAVRIGPNLISLNDPSLVKTIFNARGSYLKTDMYAVNDMLVEGHLVENMFSTRSNETHAKFLRPIQKHYTQAGLRGFEPICDEVIELFLQKLDSGFAQSGEPCPMDNWLLYMAWDFISQVSYSERLGFLEKAGDIDNILSSADSSLEYFAVINQFPILDYLFDKNPLRRNKPASFGTVIGIMVSRLIDRQLQSNPDLQAPADTQKDFLDHFIAKKSQFPHVDDNQIISWMSINMLAGADTTTSSLSAIVYHVLKDPHVLHRLQAEIRSNHDAKQPISYDHARSLPYLTAVIEEAFRHVPSVPWLLERVVPASGLTLPDGRFLPPGTHVGMNPYVVHRNKDVFGLDADVFNPDRWLQRSDESAGAFQARISRMKESELTFGGGNRVCLGKHVAAMVIWKVVAMLFGRFEVELVEQGREWEVRNHFFLQLRGIDVVLRRREGNGA